MRFGSNAFTVADAKTLRSPGPELQQRVVVEPPPLKCTPLRPTPPNGLRFVVPRELFRELLTAVVGVHEIFRRRGRELLVGEGCGGEAHVATHADDSGAQGRFGEERGGHGGEFEEVDGEESESHITVQTGQ